MAAPRRLCRTCNRKREERFFVSAQGRKCVDCRRRTRRQTSHENRVLATYGLMKGEYQTILDAQGGVCAVCKERRPYRLNVDHDHEVERAALAAGDDQAMAARKAVRGLLCRRCNGRLLPASMNRPEVHEAAAEYLRNPPARPFLRLDETT